MKKLIRVMVAVLCIASMLCVCAACGNGRQTAYQFSTVTEAETAEKQNRDNNIPMTQNTLIGGYAVSSSNDDATRVGMQVLDAGGNAVDAAIAMGYVLGVVEPFSNGLGGSGGMLIYDSVTEESTFLDYRACAGAEYGSDQVAIPGFVAGMEEAHRLYGTLRLEDLIAPAIDYAENGFTVTSFLSSMSYGHSYLTSAHKEYLDNNGELLQTGDTMYQPVLAETLKQIQKEGAHAFYHGTIAEDIARVSSLSTDDLTKYEVHQRDALHAEYQGYTVYSANAPLSGLMLLQMLSLSEVQGMPDPKTDLNGYLDELQTITVAAKSARYQHVSDPAFSDTDCQEYLTQDGLRYSYTHIAADNDASECTETTSFSVVDKNGLAVSVTNTLSDMFGSGIYVDGFWLNDTNSNFSASGVNQFEPYKRSRTFTCPTIVAKENFVMAIGSPGGNKICSILFSVLSAILKDGMDYQEAVTKLRYLYCGNDLYIETDTNGNTAIGDEATYQPAIYVQTGYSWGSVAIAGQSEGTAFSAYDYRRGATMSGVHN